MEESCKKMPVLRTLIPDECLEGITILTVCGAPEEMKGFIFDRLALEGQPPSEEFFNTRRVNNKERKLIDRVLKAWDNETDRS